MVTMAMADGGRGGEAEERGGGRSGLREAGGGMGGGSMKGKVAFYASGEVARPHSDDSKRYRWIWSWEQPGVARAKHTWYSEVSVNAVASVRSDLSVLVARGPCVGGRVEAAEPSFSELHVALFTCKCPYGCILGYAAIYWQESIGSNLGNNNQQISTWPSIPP